MEVFMYCPMCGKEHSVVVDFYGYCIWQGGELIQDALPELSPTEREQLISNFCPTCQEKIFGGE